MKSWYSSTITAEALDRYWSITPPHDVIGVGMLPQLPLHDPTATITTPLFIIFIVVFFLRQKVSIRERILSPKLSEIGTSDVVPRMPDIWCYLWKKFELAMFHTAVAKAPQNSTFSPLYPKGIPKPHYSLWGMPEKLLSPIFETFILCGERYNA